MLSIWKKEIQVLLEKRKLVCLILFFGAAAYALLIGNLYNGHIVQNIPMAVVDMDDSMESRALIQAIFESDQYTLQAYVGREEEGRPLLEDKKVAALVVIPQNFSKSLAAGETVQVGLISDGSNTLVQSYSLAPIQTVIATFAAAQAQKTAMAAGIPQLPPVPVSLSVRMTQNQTNSYAFFYMYGVMITAAQIGIMLSVALSFYHGLKEGDFKRLGVWKTLLAKEIFYILCSMAAACIGLFCLVGLFQFPFRGSFAAFLLLYGCFALAAANLAGLFALYFRTELALVQALVFYALPAFLLSGYIWPTLGMLPLWNWMSALIPLHYVIPHVRSMALGGSAGGSEADAAVLLAFGLIIFVINGIIIRRRRQHGRHEI